MQAIKLTMASRTISHKLRHVAALPFNSRNNSTVPKKDFILVDVNDKTGVALVTLNNLPVNTMSLEFLSAFSKTLDDLKANNTKGMILTSVSLISY